MGSNIITIGNAQNVDNRAWDFTGLQYDTKEECNASGLWFHDDVVLFPTSLGITGFTTFSGTWGHTAGAGWKATGIGNAQVAGLIARLQRQDFQADLTINFAPTDVGEEVLILVGGLTASNHLGFYGYAADASAVASQLQWYLLTNDGDDTTTARYSGGAALAGAGIRYLKIKSINSVLSVYDQQAGTWNDYEGHQNAICAYSYDYLFIGIYKYNAVNLAPVYLRKLEITYPEPM